MEQQPPSMNDPEWSQPEVKKDNHRMNRGWYISRGHISEKYLSYFLLHDGTWAKWTLYADHLYFWPTKEEAQHFLDAYIGDYLNADLISYLNEGRKFKMPLLQEALDDFYRYMVRKKSA